jgi:flagellar hook-associated protein 3 FlgL
MVTVSTSAFYGRSNQQLASLRTRAEAMQTQIGTEQRLTRSSDDPAAAARLRTLDRRERLTAVDQGNSNRATADLKLADQAVTSMADIVIRAKELALQARSSTLSNAGHKVIATEITNLRASLLSLANARDAAGHALFGGEAAGDPYSETAGVIAYQGVGTAPLTDLGEGQSIQRSMTGPDILSFGGTDLFAVLGNLAAGLSSGGAAAIGAAGDAIGLLDAGLEQVTTAQTVIGTRQAWVETVNDRRTATSELVGEERQEIGGADLPGTITRLKELMTVLEASQASFVKLSSLMLFNQLN